jgi:hypothetical protein
MLGGGSLLRVAYLYYTPSLPVESIAPSVQDGSSTYAKRGFTREALLLLKWPSIGLVEAIVRPDPQKRIRSIGSNTSKAISRSIQMPRDNLERYRLVMAA